MRCYFHLVNGSEEIRDTEGLEVSDLDQAHAEALEPFALSLTKTRRLLPDGQAGVST